MATQCHLGAEPSRRRASVVTSRRFRTLTSVIRRFSRLPKPARHGLAASLALTAALLAGCSGEGVETDCGLDSCVVTFDRGVEVSAHVLGIEARLVRVDGSTVTVEVAGERLTLTHDQEGVEVAGLAVTLDRVTDSQVSIRIGRA